MCRKFQIQGTICSIPKQCIICSVPARNKTRPIQNTAQYASLPVVFRQTSGSSIALPSVTGCDFKILLPGGKIHTAGLLPLQFPTSANSVKFRKILQTSANNPQNSQQKVKFRKNNENNRNKSAKFRNKSAKIRKLIGV